jgi:LysM repeat protein
MPRRRRRPRPGVAHYAAPVALLAGVTIAVLLIHSALGGHRGSTTTTGSTTTLPTRTTTGTTGGSAAKKYYLVQTGDTFGTIAAKVGISLERLQALNPGVSSNALQVGQKLRIR